MTNKQKLYKILNLYGLNLNIKDGIVTITDIENGVELETSYVEDKCDIMLANEVKTSSAAELLGVKGRRINANFAVPKLKIHCSIELNNFEPILIRKYITKIDYDKKTSEEYFSSIRKNQILNIGIYDFKESLFKGEIDGYHYVYHTRVRAKDNEFSKSITIRESACNGESSKYKHGAIRLEALNDGSNNFAFDDKEYEVDNIGCDEIFSILDKIPHVKEAISITSPELYNYYKLSYNGFKLINDYLEKHNIKVDHDPNSEANTIAKKLAKALKKDKERRNNDDNR